MRAYFLFGLSMIFFQYNANASYPCVRFDLNLLHSFVPNCKDRYFSKGRGLEFISYNSLGLRDKDYPKFAASGVLRILLQSDSVAIGRSNDKNLARVIEREINVYLEKNRKVLRIGSRKFYRVEIISGAEGGYNVIQLLIRSSKLDDAYNPHVIILLSPVESGIDNLMLDHWAAKQRDSTGLVTAHGMQSKLWPMPIELEHYFAKNFNLWQLPGTLRLHRWSLALQIAMLKYLIRLNPPQTCKALIEKNCPAGWYLKYLDEFHRRVLARGKKFIFLYEDLFSEHELVSRANYVDYESAHWIARNWLAPWDSLSKDDRIRLEQLLREKNFSINIGSAHADAWKKVPAEDQSLVGAHLPDGPFEYFGLSIARLLVSHMETGRIKDLGLQILEAK